MDRYTVLIWVLIFVQSATLLFVIYRVLFCRPKQCPTLKRAIIKRSGDGYFIQLQYSGGFRRRVRIDQLLPQQQMDLKIDLGAEDRKQMMINSLHDPGTPEPDDPCSGNMEMHKGATPKPLEPPIKLDVTDAYGDPLTKPPPGPPDPPRPPNRREVA